MNPSDMAGVGTKMSAEKALATALALAADHDVKITKVISIRFIPIEQRLTYEHAEGGMWIVLLEESSPHGEEYGTEECIVLVEDTTGKAMFEMTL